MKKGFVVKLILFIVFSFIIPIVYLIVRHNLFVPTTKMQIGLWGIVVLFILFFALRTLITFYLEGLKTKWTYFKQLVEGFSKLILPLILFLIGCIWLQNNMNLVIEALIVIIPCEVVGICLNPFPKWCFENNVDGLGQIADKVFGKGE